MPLAFKSSINCSLSFQRFILLSLLSHSLDFTGLTVLPEAIDFRGS